MYNEEPNVEPVSLELLDAFRKAGVDLELILVDNGSLDQTREKIEGLVRVHPQVKLVKVFPNEGFGWGILCGLEHARGRAVSWTGGDGQISAEDVLKIYQRFARGDVVLCKANRVKRGDGPQRILITLFWNLLFKVMFGLADPDINGTPKVMLRKELEWLKLTQRDWFLDAELVLKMADHGASKTEVTVEFLPRLRGRSNVRLPTLIEFFVNMCRYRLRFWRQRLRGKGWFE
jgi:glycosyltransferase involved in cell wall biosynthesis